MDIEARVLELTEKRHRNFLEPVKHRVNVRIIPIEDPQSELFGSRSVPGDKIDEMVAALYLSRAYEAMAAAIFGGKLMHGYLYNGHKNGPKSLRDAVNHYFDGAYVKPDLVDEKNGVVTEVKASLFVRALDLSPTQLDKYFRIQCSAPKLRVRIIDFKHPVRKIKKIPRTQQEILTGLTSATSYCLVLPLSIVKELYYANKSECPEVRRLVYKAKEGKSSTPFTSVLSTTQQAFLRDPNEVLELLGFNPENFSFKRYRSDPKLHFYDSNYKIYPVKPFPILEIREKACYHTSWTTEFAEGYHTQMDREEREAIYSPDQEELFPDPCDPEVPF